VPFSFLSGTFCNTAPPSFVIRYLSTVSSASKAEGLPGTVLVRVTLLVKLVSRILNHPPAGPVYELLEEEPPDVELPPDVEEVDDELSLDELLEEEPQSDPQYPMYVCISVGER
jgi:hypothetical protein